MIKGWGLWDRGRIGAGRSGIAPSSASLWLRSRAHPTVQGAWLGLQVPRGRGQGGLGDKVLIKSWTFLCCPPLQLTASHFSWGRALREDEDRNKLVTSRLISQETYSVVAKNR